MAEQLVRVECYSGYKANERPVRMHMGGRTFEVVAIEDRWYSPGATIFRIVADDGDRYVLRHEEAQDVWTRSLRSYPINPCGVGVCKGGAAVR
jgi:hypothetical protein